MSEIVGLLDRIRTDLPFYRQTRIRFLYERVGGDEGGLIAAGTKPTATRPARVG